MAFRRAIVSVVVVAMAVIGASCSSETAKSGADVAINVGVRTITAEGFDPGVEVTLSGGEGQRATTTSLGAVVFRNLDPSGTYRIEQGGYRSAEIRVKSIDDVPSQEFYTSQVLKHGYQYVTMRDGTTLAASVYLPPGDGPFPTVVEYSGYDEARPGRNYREQIEKAGIPADVACGLAPYLCDAPMANKGLFGAMFGYAVVDVNARGTGCSGGAFELITDQFKADGYDIIETVAAQPWVKGHKVGMVGGSFPGYTQIGVAATNPPHLAAIAAEVPLNDAVADTAVPGGLLNEGFALAWTQAVEDGAKPYGQGWERARVDAGDTTCENNQRLHEARDNLLARANSERYYPDDLRYLDLGPDAQKVTVPVMISVSWQDEQVGPGAGKICDKFTNAPVRKCVMGNGSHGEQSPELNLLLKAFLDFYVNGERQKLSDAARTVYPVFMENVIGAQVPFPAEEPFLGAGDGSDTDAQRALFEQEPGVTLLLDVGDGGIPAGSKAGAVVHYDAWPPSNAEVRYFNFEKDRAVEASTKVGESAIPTLAATFHSSNELMRQTTAVAGSPDFGHVGVRYDWQHERPGEAIVQLSDAAVSDQLIMGPGRSDLWIRSSADGADIGMTLSEVAPDGTERFIQAAVVRGEMGQPGPDATATDPRITGRESDAVPIKAGQWHRVSVPIPPFAHLLRAGSRLKFSIHSPGGDKSRWTYRPDPLLNGAEPDVTVGRGGDRPSWVALNVLPAPVHRPLPACGVLRTQPCRPYVAYTNTQAAG
jgi:predicted acyl esterase